jgi:uncharacterized membrane protein
MRRGKQPRGAEKDGFWTRARKNFLTGVVLVAPLYLTFWVVSSFVSLIDAQAEDLLPSAWNPQTYFDLPGVGLLVFFVLTALLGALAKNLFMVEAIRFGERVLDRLPVVRSIYNGIKQIAETILQQSNRSFDRACLIEYPRKGLWALAFISTETRGEVRERAGRGDMVSVFLPTTPNPTSGFLLFVPRADVIELDMSVEEAAKLVISAGLVTPPHKPVAPPRPQAPRPGRDAGPRPAPLPAE